MEIILTLISCIATLFTVVYYLKNRKEINLLDLKSTPKSLFLSISFMILVMKQLEIKEKMQLNGRLNKLSSFIENYDKNKLETERQKIAYEELKKIDKSCKFSEKEIDELEKFRALLEIVI